MQNLFRISTPQELQEYCLKATFPDKRDGAYLANDIDMSGVDWDPVRIETFDGAFSPVFDGNGYTIKGLECRPKKFLCLEEVRPSAGGYSYNTRVFGGLFASSESLRIRNLRVQGKMSIKKEQLEPLNTLEKRLERYNLIVGGLTGYIDKRGEIENCRVEIDVEYDSQVTYEVAGIAGALEGEMKNCVYSGNIIGGAGIGLAYMNSGRIENSYAVSTLTNGFYPETMRHIIYPTSSEIKAVTDGYKGAIDNLELYLPGGAYHTGTMKKFWESDTIRQLLSADVFLEKPLKESYWVNTIIHKIAIVAEENARGGVPFGLGEDGAVSYSLLPLQYIRYRTNKEARLYSSRYAAMLEVLIKESPSFRESFLRDINELPENTLNTLARNIGSKKRLAKIIKHAQKYADYDTALQTDADYMESMYERI